MVLSTYHDSNESLSKAGGLYKIKSPTTPLAPAAAGESGGTAACDGGAPTEICLGESKLNLCSTTVTYVFHHQKGHLFPQSHHYH